MIGIICAMAIEVDGLKELMTDKTEEIHSKMTFTKGKIGGRELVAVECGVGKVNAAMCAQTMIDFYSPEVIINSGVAGATSEEVTLCDMVVGTEVVQHDMNTAALGSPIGEITFPDENRIYFPCDEKVAEKLYNICKTVEDSSAFMGRIASGDIFVSRRSKREILYIRFQALACEMEGAAIGHVCFRNDVPFCVFRTISDDLENNKGMDFKIFSVAASEKSIKVISEFIKNY